MSSDLTEPRTEQRPVARHLGAGAAFSVIADAGTLIAGTALSITLARTVGPSGNGTFALLLTTMNIAVLVVSLGITSGITYQVSHRCWGVRSALLSSVWLSLGLGLLGTAAALGFYLVTEDSVMQDVAPHLAIIGMAAITPALLFQFIAAILLGRDRYEGYATLLLVNAGLILFGAVALALVFGTTGAVLGFTGATAVTALVGIWLAVHRAPGGVGTPSAPGRVYPALYHVRKSLRFGLQAWPANILQQVNYRFDLLILGAYVSASHVGVYSVAVTVVQIGWILPHGIQTVLFPRAARLDAAARAGELTGADNDAAMTRATRHTVLLLVPSGIIVAALLALVPLVYGRKFDETVLLGLILLPGVLVLGVGKVLGTVVTGRGRPVYLLYTGIISAAFTVALYLTLIPRYHEWAAAGASTLSYVGTTIIVLIFFRKVTRIPLATALVPTRADIGNYFEAASTLVSHLQSRRVRRARTR